MPFAEVWVGRPPSVREEITGYVAPDGSQLYPMKMSVIKGVGWLVQGVFEEEGMRKEVLKEWSRRTGETERIASVRSVWVYS